MNRTTPDPTREAAAQRTPTAVDPGLDPQRLVPRSRVHPVLDRLSSAAVTLPVNR